MKNNILLTRIDNRLIHGQIVGEWAGTIGANLLVVVDDDVANNEMEKSIMQIAADALGVGVRFFTVAKTIEVISKASSNQKILLICRIPKTVRRLIDGGVIIDKVNIGNMHPDPDEIQLGLKVYVNKDELADLEYIKSKVKEIYIQDLPSYERKEF